MPSPSRHAVFLFVFPTLLLLGAADRAAAAVVCDLRTSSTCAPVNGGLFFTDEQHPTGTGFIDSFLRIQQKGWEQGYNTSARPIQSGMDSKTDPNFTRDLLLSEVGTKTIGGTVYREFFLDVNEPAAANPDQSWITLDQLEIFVSEDASLNNYSATGANDASGSLMGAAKIYDLDTATEDGYVQLDYLVSSKGSGSSDMVFYLDNALFANQKYVYLFSQFGDITGRSPKKFESQAGFEEWFTKAGVPPVNVQAIPEPGTLLLLGSGLALAARRRLKRQPLER